MSTFVTRHANEQGIKTEDAKRSLEIEVTQSDIRKAKVKNAKCCAFACAVKRQMPDVKAAYFFRSAAWVEYENKMVRYQLPMAVQKEIVSFDRSHIMEPGTYIIAKPCKSKALGQHEAATPKASVGKKRKRNRTKGIRTLIEPGEAD